LAGFAVPNVRHKEDPVVGTQIHRTIFDDLDASTDGVGTYRFALEGVEYEIDLSNDNVGRLRTALDPFIAAGRRLPKTQAASRRSSAGSGPSDAPRMRTWWAANQQALNLPPHRTRGAIPPKVRDAYRAAR
jgi:hypothetical protein